MTKIERDQTQPDETKQKLIEAAGEVFAEAGFENATVREICSRAGANIAAVNYHFRDKLGLYTEVLKSAMMAQQGAAPNADMAHPADPRAGLKTLIHDWLGRMTEGNRRSWLARIMAHEMSHPTPALDRVAEAMGPSYLQFRKLVGRIIGRDPEDSRTRMCVHSVVGQVLQYTQSRPMLERLWPSLDLDNEKQRRAIADHIVAFSLAGMEQFARRKGEPAARKSR
jgi:TetR/AcrR family transcriptional regulator, regulator of cefoperazone and chloramphenicol sensitivity